MIDRDTVKEDMALAEIESIQQRPFWQKYIKRIEDKKKYYSGKCETDWKDIRYHQGMVQAIKDVLRIPEDFKKEREAGSKRLENVR